MENLRQKLKTVPQKIWILVAVGLLIVVTCTALTVGVIRQKRAAQAAACTDSISETVTESVTETTTETTTELTTEPTTAAPKKPVGTTAPVAREEPAPTAKGGTKGNTHSKETFKCTVY